MDPMVVGARAVRRGLKAIEEEAKKNNSEYLVDDQLSMADVLLVP